MSGSQLQIAVKGAVIEIAMACQPVNAINLALSREMYDAFRRLNEDDSLRVGLLYSAGNDRNIFSAGWDLKAFAAGESVDAEQGFDLYKPVVVALSGGAIGGGFELALGGDVIVCSEDAYFWLPEMQRGFLPEAGAIQKLHHRIPWNVAVDLILTGRRMYADEAKHWGLVRDVVPADALLDYARGIAATIADGAPLVAAALKEYLRRYGHASVEESHAAVRRAWVGKSDLPHCERMIRSNDFREGSVAFSEKRAPSFKG